MIKQNNISNLEYLAASQWGMFTTAQARGLGVRRNQIARLASSGRIEMMCYGVYRFAAGAEAEQSGMKAAWLSAFPERTVYDRLDERPFDAVIAGRTAACALGAGDFRASPYTFLVTRRRQTSRDDVRFLTCSLNEGDVVFADGVPTTSFERTVFDLMRLAEDPDLVDGFMRDAVVRVGHVFDRKRLSELLAPLAERFGYERGDGSAFADDLIARNIAAIQISKAGESIGRVLESLPIDVGGKGLADYPGIETALRGLADAFAAAGIKPRLSESDGEQHGSTMSPSNDRGDRQ